MGPQLVRCGMHTCMGYGGRGLDKLQWGRNLFVAEWSPPAGRPIAAWTLQWGRNLFVAECGPGPPAARDTRLASMGPQLVRCGMHTRTCRTRDCCRCFNGAATCSLRNDNRKQKVLWGSYKLQWGRNLFVAEWSPAPSIVSGAGRGFNGAATCSLRNEIDRGG